MNGDGFRELAVGAPLEDDHQGAVYIFYGLGRSVQQQPRQVGVPWRLYFPIPNVSCILVSEREILIKETLPFIRPRPRTSSSSLSDWQQLAPPQVCNTSARVFTA